MRTSVSILLLILCVVLGSLAVGNPADSSPAANSAASAASGFGRGDFWWSSYPAGEICEHESYPAYDHRTHELSLRRGSTFARVLERGVQIAGGLTVAPGCTSIAGVANNTLVIWDVASGDRRAELPNAGDSPLVIWRPDGASAFARTNNAYYLWQGDRTVALRADTSHGDDLEAWTLDVAAYPAVYWDAARGQVIVGAVGGALAFDAGSGALRQVFALDGAGQFRVRDHLLIMSGYSGIKVWNLAAGGMET